MFTNKGDLSGKIRRAEEKAQLAREKVGKLETEVRVLSKKLESLSLTTQSLWEMLRDQSDVTEKDLESKIKEVFAREEDIDWKVPGQVTVCTHCGSNTDTRRKICLMCGEPLD